MHIQLAFCDLVTARGDTDLCVNIGLGNNYLPYGIKPLYEPLLTCYQMCPLAFTCEEFHKTYLLVNVIVACDRR